MILFVDLSWSDLNEDMENSEKNNSAISPFVTPRFYFYFCDLKEMFNLTNSCSSVKITFAFTNFNLSNSLDNDLIVLDSLLSITSFKR